MRANEDRRKPAAEFLVESAWNWIVDKFLLIVKNIRSIKDAFLLVSPFTVKLLAGYFGYSEEVALLTVFMIGLMLELFSIVEDFNSVGASGFPLPSKKFTTENEDGEVFVEKRRLQEMILYVCEVEDYLESHGYVLNISDNDDDTLKS